MRKTFALLVAVVLTSMASAQHAKKPLTTVNESTAAPARLQPVSYSNLYCSGFLTSKHVPHDNYVEGGWYAPNGVRYTTGEYVYIHGNLPEGNEFDIVREVRDPMKYQAFGGQSWALRGLGSPYADIGRVKIVGHSGKVSIGLVVFSCETALPGDFAIPYREREPVNVASLMAFDPFNAGPSHTKGRIVMARDFDVYVGAGQVVYLNVGSNKGVKVGDYFRAVRGYTSGEQDEADALSYKATIADDTQVHPLATDSSRINFGMSASTHDMPIRGLGELVVVGVTPKSSAAMVTFSLEEVRVGDHVVKDEQPQIVIGPAAQAGPAMASASSGIALASSGMQPPSIACIAQPERLRAGAMATISCDASSPDLRPVNVSFSTDRGEISGEGQTGLLQTAGLQPGPIHVLATVFDDRNLSSSAGTIVSVEAAPAAPLPPPPPPAASKIQEVTFKPASVYVNNDAKAKLDDVALRVQRDTQMKIVIVGRGKLDTPAGKRIAERRAENVKTYLTREKGVDATRIELRTQAGDNRTDIWVIPPGASMPELEQPKTDEAAPKSDGQPKADSQTQTAPKADAQPMSPSKDDKPQAGKDDPFQPPAPKDTKPQN